MATLSNPSIYTEFQTNTIQWCFRQLFSSKRGVKRFLVADEVGLGKTMVAKGLIEKLNKNIRHPCIVYVCSSLDIINQNRNRLSSATGPNNDPPGRITLIKAYRQTKKSQRMYFLTPGTSLFISNSTGIVEERLYMAWLAKKMFQIPQSRIVRVFKCNAPSFGKKFRELRKRSHEQGRFFNLDKVNLAKLRNHWKQYTIILRSGKDTEFSKVVKTMRLQLAKILVDSLSPDLIILDEFQKFKDILIPDKHDEKNICSLLVKPSAPTLLLSATPYKLLSQNIGSISPGETSHYDEFLKVLSFLTGDATHSKSLLDRIKRHGMEVKELLEKKTPDGPGKITGNASFLAKQFKDFQNRKENLEKDLTQYISRTERVFFQLKESGSITTKFLSEDDPLSYITKDEIKEFLILAPHVRRTELLSYWKSGSHLVSYLQDYILGNQLRKKRSISGNRFLYTQFKHSPPRNRKLEYVAKDIKIDEEASKYLWIPPIRPYYEGEGIFKQDVIKRVNIKKGLIFSSWKFVPRQVAAELSRMRDGQYRIFKKKYQIKVTPVTWCSFFHPSKILSDCLLHDDFVNAKDIKDLKERAFKNIRSYLKDLGIEMKGGQMGAKPWEVLRQLEYYHDQGSWRKLIWIYRNPVSRSRKNDEKNERHLIEPRYLDYLNKDFEESITVNRKTIEELAMIAISSPAVAIRRGMSFLVDRTILESSAVMEELVRICLIEIRSYLSRYTTVQCVKSAYKHGSYHRKIANYFRDGNFQAVIDEFLFCIAGTFEKQNIREEAVQDLLYKLKCVFQYRKSVLMPFKGKKARHRVNTHLAMAFGESQEEGASRDDLRISFNSPFWPFVLATTSVGQEGLDFHLYCKDIYHWNLPSNPVDFEQREGRLTRYNSLAIREAVMSLKVPLNGGLNDKTYWQHVFEGASAYCHYNDRYNLGLSPNWICTTGNNNAQPQLVRHILDLPYSSDKRRYQSLVERLRLYRLALGQPNPDSYLRELEQENALGGIDARSLYLNLFPFDKKRHTIRLKTILNSISQIKQLAKDAEVKASEFCKSEQEIQIRELVNKICGILEPCISSQSYSSKTIKPFRSMIEALLHFVDINDQVNDRLPVIGYKDDLHLLKQALRGYRADL